VDPVETLALDVFVDGTMFEVPPGGLGATKVGVAVVAVVAVVIAGGDDALAKIWKMCCLRLTTSSTLPAIPRAAATSLRCLCPIGGSTVVVVSLEAASCRE
jgi:hypothetical protein